MVKVVIISNIRVIKFIYLIYLQVLYVGKIKVSHPKVSEAFIDDALIRFRVHGLEKSRSSASNILSEYQRQSLLTSSNNRRNSTVNTFYRIIVTRKENPIKLYGTLKLNLIQESSASETGSIENVSGSGIISPVNPLGVPSTLTGSVETFPKSHNSSLTEKEGHEENRDAANNNASQIPEIMRNRASSTGSVLNPRRDSMIRGGDEHNRTMLFQVRHF